MEGAYGFLVVNELVLVIDDCVLLNVQVFKLRKTAGKQVS